MTQQKVIYSVFQQCVKAIKSGKLIVRESKTDKEFHFQNWIRDRLTDTGFHHEMGGRNKYPDFRMVEYTEGYEVKGLAYPGRIANFDSNSQAPSGFHNGRVIYYIFGRYPKKPDGNSYPVLDLVICHGDFLNADHEYEHKNKSIKGFGCYGDIMIRDRKMYVVPTPFGLVSGVAHSQTLILPEEYPKIKGLKKVGSLIRKEAEKVVVGYKFDLKTNDITKKTVPNPWAGREHKFIAWRFADDTGEKVELL